MNRNPAPAEPRRPDGAAPGPSRSAAAASRSDEWARIPRPARDYGEAMVYAGAPSLSPTRYCPAAARTAGSVRPAP